MLEKITAAQIGVGYWGPNLLRNLIGTPRCKVKMVADISEERRNFVSNLYPRIKVTPDIESVFTDSTIHAVVISTPVATHFDLVCRALKSGKHVLVEKPMAQSVEEIDEIERLAKQAGLVAMVGHTFLFNSAVKYLREMIVTGQLGDIRYIYSQRLNLGRIRSDVDALWNLAPHDVSIIQYLLGNREPVRIQRTGMDFIQKGVDDVVFLNIEYPDKILAHVHVSWLDPHKVRSLTVVGSKKMVVYDDVADNKIAVYDKGIEPKAVLGERMDYDAGMPPVFVHRSGDVNLPSISWREPLKTEVEHFFDCIEGNAICITGPDHARNVVGILEGAKR
jgi:predicted dehydrogenase